MSAPGALRGRRALDGLRLETHLLTAVYWATVALWVLAILLPRFPPLVDYPQHLAVASLLRRWFDPASPERQIYDANFFTYNGAFHVSAALLGLVLPMETAGRVVLGAIPVVYAGGALAVVRAAGRPRWYALLLLPLCMNGMVLWGFLNNVLSYGAALSVFALGYRALRAPAPARRARIAGDPRWWGVAAGGLLVAMLHIFGAFVLCMSLGLVALRGALLHGRERLGGLVRTCVALAPSVGLAAAFVLHNRASSYSNWENSAHDGWDDYAWRKVLHFADLTVGSFLDRSDQHLFYLLLGVLLFLYWPRKQRAPGPRDLRMLAGIYFVLYLITPRVLFATWFVFERLALLTLVFAVAAAPTLAAGASRYVRIFVASLALLTAGNAALHYAAIPDEEDASAVIDAIPEGARVLGLVWDPSPYPVLERATYVHLQAYHVVRHRGEMSPSFTFIESLPLHYKATNRPPRQGAGEEWSPEHYSTTEPYARYFDTVLVMAPRDETDVAALVFQGAAPRARELAHRGRVWLFDASAVVGGEDVSAGAHGGPPAAAP